MSMILFIELSMKCVSWKLIYVFCKCNYIHRTSKGDNHKMSVKWWNYCSSNIRITKKKKTFLKPKLDIQKYCFHNFSDILRTFCYFGRTFLWNGRVPWIMVLYRNIDVSKWPLRCRIRLWQSCCKTWTSQHIGQQTINISVPETNQPRSCVN